MTEFTISSMRCGHCVGAVMRAVKQADPRAAVVVDAAARKVRVQAAHDPETIRAALAQAGFAPD